MIFESALGLLCALSAATLAAAPVAPARRSLVLALSVAAFVAGAGWRVPAPGAVGCMVAVTAGVLLRWPRLRLAATVVAGLTAGWWSSMLASQGLPLGAAWVLAASVPTISAAWSWRDPEFAPTVLREEALLAVGGGALLVAAGPSIVDGWRAAAVLNLDPAGGVRQAMGAWVVVLTAISVSLGGWHSLRRRR